GAEPGGDDVVGRAALDHLDDRLAGPAGDPPHVGEEHQPVAEQPPQAQPVQPDRQPPQQPSPPPRRGRRAHDPHGPLPSGGGRRPTWVRSIDRWPNSRPRRSRYSRIGSRHSSRRNPLGGDGVPMIFMIVYLPPWGGAGPPYGRAAA